MIFSAYVLFFLKRCRWSSDQRRAQSNCRLLPIRSQRFRRDPSRSRPSALSRRVVKSRVAPSFVRTWMSRAESQTPPRNRLKASRTVTLRACVRHRPPRVVSRLHCRLLCRRPRARRRRLTLVNFQMSVLGNITQRRLTLIEWLLTLSVLNRSEKSKKR